MPKESEFTAPTVECPYPELWHAPDGQSTEQEVTQLVGAFIAALKPSRVLETGTAYGYTARQIGWMLRLHCPTGELVSLEIDPAMVAHARTLCLSMKHVRILQESSLEYVPESSIDFAWFDSLTHLRAPEFRRFYPWFHHRTVVGFHDTGPQHPTRPWVQQLIDEGLLDGMFLPTPRGVFFGRVRKDA